MSKTKELLSGHQYEQLQWWRGVPKSEALELFRLKEESDIARIELTQVYQTAIGLLKKDLARERKHLDNLCQKKNQLRRTNFFLAHELRLKNRERSLMSKEIEELKNMDDEWQTSIEMLSYETELVGVDIMNLQSEIKKR
mmetsp:Transcript_29472/g.44960  ORF Transcript_29472/g.44960 Transcript_29472/m.44960 type:complete len:140 (+) Transcript_29472:133-552(+)